MHNCGVAARGVPDLFPAVSVAIPDRSLLVSSAVSITVSKAVSGGFFLSVSVPQVPRDVEVVVATLQEEDEGAGRVTVPPSTWQYDLAPLTSLTKAAGRCTFCLRGLGSAPGYAVADGHITRVYACRMFASELVLRFLPHRCLATIDAHTDLVLCDCLVLLSMPFTGMWSCMRSS